MHKAISTKVQGKTCLETKLNKAIKLFGFSNFYVLLKILNTPKADQEKKINNDNRYKITAEKIEQCMKRCNSKCPYTLKEFMRGHVIMLMHEYPSSPTRHVRLG